MLKMTHLSKAFRTEVVETFALRDISIHVRQGEFVAVTGPSGSGKTTFLNIAGLLETPTGGSYELDGQDVSRLGDDARSRIRNEKIGFIFQAFNLIPEPQRVRQRRRAAALSRHEGRRAQTPHR